jgi:pantoate--beta-alanine ligase
VGKGERDAGRVCTAMREKMSAAGVERIDYVALVDPTTLEPVEWIEGPVRALIAAHVGTTRLIDNAELVPPHSVQADAPQDREHP